MKSIYILAIAVVAGGILGMIGCDGANPGDTTLERNQRTPLITISSDRKGSLKYGEGETKEINQAVLDDAVIRIENEGKDAENVQFRYRADYHESGNNIIVDNEVDGDYAPLMNGRRNLRIDPDTGEFVSSGGEMGEPVYTRVLYYDEGDLPLVAILVNEDCEYVSASTANVEDIDTLEGSGEYLEYYRLPVGSYQMVFTMAGIDFPTGVTQPTLPAGVELQFGIDPEADDPNVIPLENASDEPLPCLEDLTPFVFSFGIDDEGLVTDHGDISIGYESIIDDDGDGVPLGEDCDDSDPDIYPGADEVCTDDIDNDCDGDVDSIDEDCDSPTTIRCYPDDDDDGQGDDGSTSERYEECPEGMVDNRTDCDDTDDDIYVGAPELCSDGDDNDCDGDVDDDDPECTPDVVECYDDDDNDGQGDEGSNPEEYDDSCPNGMVDNDLDCDDTDDEIYDGALEVVDGVDNDCDGLVDEDDPGCVGACNVDDDGDGYSEDQGDCNDGALDQYPGNSGDPNDGVDSNCDGSDYDGTATITIHTDSVDPLREAHCKMGGCIWEDILFDATTDPNDSGTVTVNEGPDVLVCVNVKYQNGTYMTDGATADQNEDYHITATSRDDWLYVDGNRLEYVITDNGNGPSFCFTPVVVNGQLEIQPPNLTGGYRVVLEFDRDVDVVYIQGGTMWWEIVHTPDSNRQVTLNNQIASNFIFNGTVGGQWLDGISDIDVVIRTYSGSNLVDSTTVYANNPNDRRANGQGGYNLYFEIDSTGQLQ